MTHHTQKEHTHKVVRNSDETCRRVCGVLKMEDEGDGMEVDAAEPLPRIPTDEELELMPSSTPDMPHDVHFKRYGFPDGVSGVNCFYCNAVVELPINHNLEASARTEFAKIPCMRGYIWGRPSMSNVTVETAGVPA